MPAPAPGAAPRQAAPTQPGQAIIVDHRTPPRSRRWTAAVATLIDLQDDYRTWRDKLPADLEGSSLVEKLDIIDLDLDELVAIEPPRDFTPD